MTPQYVRVTSLTCNRDMQNDMSTAREVLARILLFGIVPGGVLSALFMAGQTLLPAAFTTDAAVIAAVAHVVPLLAICMVRSNPHKQSARTPRAAAAADCECHVPSCNHSCSPTACFAAPENEGSPGLKSCTRLRRSR